MLSQEQFDIVDENNNPTGEVMLRSEVHGSDAWHRVVHIYIFRRNNDAGFDFLTHLRSAIKDLSPNKWDARFGGHVVSGETIAEAINRELEGEIGMHVAMDAFIKGPEYPRERTGNREYVAVFYYEWSGVIEDLTFNDNEVQKVEWRNESEIVESLKEEHDRWTVSSSAEEFIRLTTQLYEKSRRTT